MAVTVKFIADIANWLSGLGKTETAVDDNVTALEDLMKQAITLGREAGRTTDQIADDFSEAFGVPLDRAKRAVEEVVTATDDLGDAGQGAKTAGDDIESGISGGAEGAAGSLTELGSIATDVLSGDISGAAGGAVDALSGIAAAAGIGGAAGSAIISALGGLVTAMIDELTRFSDMAEETKQGVIQDFIDLGDGLDAAAVDKRMKKILADPDTRRQAELLQNLLKTDLPTAVLAMAGDFETAGVTVDEVMGAIADAPGNVSLEDWNSLKAQLEGVTGGLAAGPEYADAYADALSRVTIGAAQAAVAAGTATVAVDEFGNTVYSLPDGKTVTVDAATGKATEDVGAFKADVDQKTQPVTQKINVSVNTSMWDSWVPQNKFARVFAEYATSGPTAARKQPLGP